MTGTMTSHRDVTGMRRPGRHDGCRCSAFNQLASKVSISSDCLVQLAFIRYWDPMQCIPITFWNRMHMLSFNQNACVYIYIYIYMDLVNTFNVPLSHSYSLFTSLTVPVPLTPAKAVQHFINMFCNHQPLTIWKTCLLTRRQNPRWPTRSRDISRHPEC